MSKLYDFEATKLTSTEKAILLDVDGKKVWFPKTQIQENDDETFTIEEWLAIEKEIV